MAAKATVFLTDFTQHTATTFRFGVQIASHDAAYTGDPWIELVDFDASLNASQLESAIKDGVQAYMETKGVTFGPSDDVRILHAIALA